MTSRFLPRITLDPSKENKEKYQSTRRYLRIILILFKEQPLLLEDLLEQEKREQAGQSVAGQGMSNPNLINNHVRFIFVTYLFC